jgi:carboxymethylenebutenolidase
MKQDLTIQTADGSAPAWLFRPSGGAPARAGVLFFMDAMGPREAMDIMGQRLADAGYLVLLPDLFYRFGHYGPFSGASFGEEASRNQLIKMITETTQDMTARDTEAFLKVFDDEGAPPSLGVVGYCMGGSRALTVAGRFPERFAAAASFHGANLASGAPDSPHLLADRIKARVFVGTADVDGSFPVEQSTRLVEAFRSAHLDFALESFVGVQHGWTVPDRDGVYDERGAERHWARLLQLFAETI